MQAKLNVKVNEAPANVRSVLGVTHHIYVEGSRGAQYLFQRYEDGRTRFIIGLAARGLGKGCRPSMEVIAAAEAA